MSGENVSFYACIIAIGLVAAIMVNAHENFAIYPFLESAQTAWNKPCYIYGHLIDCSTLFNSYVMPYRNMRFGAGLYSPINTNNFLLTSLSRHNVRLNKFVDVPFKRNFQPLLAIPESAPRQFNIYKTSITSIAATSSEIDNSVRNKEITTNSINLNANTEPVQEHLKSMATSRAVTREYKVLTTASVSTSEHRDRNFLQYTSTTSKNISNSNEISATKTVLKPGSRLLTRNDTLFSSFKGSLDQLERKFFLSTFTKLTAISPEDRQENGISFLQSGLFLHLLLVALSTEMDKNVTREIEECAGLNMTEADKVDMIKLVVSWLPESSDVLKFRWTSRLVLGHSTQARRAFREGAADAMSLRLSWLNGTETSAEITKSLNEMVEADSGGAMHNTFEEEEVSSGVCGVALATLYVRARWRAAPTLLNDSRLFRDAADAPPRYTTLFRINDFVGYAYLHEWDAEAIEISYATPGLTLLMLVPKEPSLRKLVGKVASAGLASVQAVMHQFRAAVTLPLYTLRMTLLLPNKLEDMGMPSLLSMNETDCHKLKFSHAVQRLMFWAEAGRNAFKDDGIEWDPRPEMEIVVDRPYLFFVRWHNITIMNGNFVL